MINRENLIKIGRAGGNTSNRETPDQIGRVGMSVNEREMPFPRIHANTHGYGANPRGGYSLIWAI